ncbi:YiiX/YebB-like N1pC/P60 family cysteine hydrolase [Saccharicrinis fermentans]|uniref:Permuted papain-like amidase YaeF/Yiix C92 family enzyme n=1 Tax=Saccharicrinis fermentans DSM 9555 = JCM 21142 TaxID=869213 RepID=W7Y1S7_9BACT|nr:YiiX/YebB-like N1pC/P60 family cysteine hydrolase [Saccharicrinis fermentans]GAF04835.1 hypothetical protein JCM21142_93555 [Saccharicrinis fermentans DSM 9555 = JCM 21142]
MQKITINIIIILLLTVACSHQNKNKLIKTGDILFRANHKNGLSKAINEVTQTQSKTNYTHMGICKVLDDSVFVIHAHPSIGVCKEPLTNFCHPNGDSSYITDLYRIKAELKPNIKQALIQAEDLIGEPYDHTYILSEPGYYCSEFIYEIFKSDTLFSLNPMTFKDPASGKFHSGWLEHYQKLGLTIPEGLPGCNPNEMAAEGKLDFILRLEK